MPNHHRTGRGRKPRKIILPQLRAEGVIKRIIMLRIANALNGLAYTPYDSVSMFLSTHGHNYKMGYFRLDAMPYEAVIELLLGNTIQLVDATQHNKPLPDSFKFGLTTWCLVFNRAIGCDVRVADWQTREMIYASRHNHRALVQRIRRLKSVFGASKPAIIGDNILLEVHKQVKFDDKPYLLKELLEAE